MPKPAKLTLPSDREVRVTHTSMRPANWCGMRIPSPNSCSNGRAMMAGICLCATSMSASAAHTSGSGEAAKTARVSASSARSPKSTAIIIMYIFLRSTFCTRSAYCPEMSPRATRTYSRERWRSLPTPSGKTFEWDRNSTYVRKPPYFDGMPKTGAGVRHQRCAGALRVTRLRRSGPSLRREQAASANLRFGGMWTTAYSGAGGDHGSAAAARAGPGGGIGAISVSEPTASARTGTWRPR